MKAYKQHGRTLAYAQTLTGLAIALVGITFGAAGDSLNTAAQVLLFAAEVCLALTLGVLIAGMREAADRIKEEVEGR
jgi:sulfite exporter TauE/SafE